MRWRPIPELEGFTEPFGTVHDPFASLGIAGPLRMALSQPELVGEDLGADDYGATLVRGNHFGGDPYWGAYVPRVLESRKRRSVPGAIAEVLETLRQSGKDAGVDTAAALSVRTGVPFTEAALEVISTRKMGSEELQARLANTQAAHENARKAGKRNKARRLKVRIMALQSRLTELERGTKHPVKDLPGSAGDSLRIPPWLTYAGVGLGAASLIVAFIGMRGKPK